MDKEKIKMAAEDLRLRLKLQFLVIGVDDVVNFAVDMLTLAYEECAVIAESYRDSTNGDYTVACIAEDIRGKKP